jgi:hypothetical protein
MFNITEFLIVKFGSCDETPTPVWVSNSFSFPSIAYRDISSIINTPQKEEYNGKFTSSPPITALFQNFSTDLFSLPFPSLFSPPTLPPNLLPNLLTATRRSSSPP